MSERYLHIYICWLRAGPRADSSFVLFLVLFLLSPPTRMPLCQQANADDSNEGNLFKMLKWNPCLKTHSQGQSKIKNRNSKSQQMCWAPGDKED